MATHNLSAEPDSINGGRVIQLTQGHVAIVDEADFSTLSRYRWMIFRNNGRLYANRLCKSPNGKRTLILMHREITGAVAGQVVDHKNGDGLDNRRENIRICTGAQNSQNIRRSRGASRFKGVSIDRGRGKWRAVIQSPDGKYSFLGYFDDEKDAARVYDAAALQLFGEFACTNADIYGDF